MCDNLMLVEGGGYNAGKRKEIFIVLKKNICTM
jgi:hypothetical protein